MARAAKRRASSKEVSAPKPGKIRRVSTRRGAVTGAAGQKAVAERSAVPEATSSLSSLGSDDASSLTSLDSLDNDAFDIVNAKEAPTLQQGDQPDTSRLTAGKETGVTNNGHGAESEVRVIDSEKEPAMLPCDKNGVDADSAEGLEKIANAVKESNSKKDATFSDGNVKASAAGSTAKAHDVKIQTTPLGASALVDRAKLQPVQYVRIDGYGNTEGGIQYAALHKCLDEQEYRRIMGFALAAGCHPDLVNLAACDPETLKWSDKSYITDLQGNVIRFFLVGLTAAGSQLFAAQLSRTYDNNGRAGIQLLPALAVGRRAMGAIAAVDGWASLRTYTREAALNISSLSQGRDSNISIATESDSFMPQKNAVRPAWRDNVLKAFTDVPLYDGRGVDFDITNFQKLPRLKEDIPKGSVVCAVFTLRKWGKPVTVSFNIMSVIWIGERSGDPNVHCNAWEELPYLVVT